MKKYLIFIKDYIQEKGGITLTLIHILMLILHIILLMCSIAVFIPSFNKVKIKLDIAAILIHIVMLIISTTMLTLKCRDFCEKEKIKIEKSIQEENKKLTN